MTDGCADVIRAREQVSYTITCWWSCRGQNHPQLFLPAFSRLEKNDVLWEKKLLPVENVNLSTEIFRSRCTFRAYDSPRNTGSTFYSSTLCKLLLFFTSSPRVGRPTMTSLLNRMSVKQHAPHKRFRSLTVE